MTKESVAGFTVLLIDYIFVCDCIGLFDTFWSENNEPTAMVRCSLNFDKSRFINRDNVEHFLIKKKPLQIVKIGVVQSDFRKSPESLLLVFFVQNKNTLYFAIVI